MVATVEFLQTSAPGIKAPVEAGTSTTELEEQRVPLEVWDDSDTFDLILEVPGKRLVRPIEAHVQWDEVHWLATTEVAPLYATGASREEAVESLAHEIGMLIDELEEMDEREPEWDLVLQRLREYVER